ncbi:MAG: hypothetical protein ABIK92_06690 [Pseudomonadota bacterium]
MKRDALIIIAVLLVGWHVALAEQKELNSPNKQGGWIIQEYNWENKQDYIYDWNDDSHPEALGVEFRGAGAQTHWNLVLKDGKTGNYIYKAYTFNCPHYGVFEKKGEAPIIFFRVLGNLKEVLTSDKESDIYPSPYPQLSTATYCCSSYYRLITYLDGSFQDVSSQYPNLLWQVTVKFSDSVGQNDEVDELWAVELLYYQTRTGMVIPDAWLNSVISTDFVRKKILSLIAHFQKNEDILVSFFQLEKNSLLSGRGK